MSNQVLYLWGTSHRAFTQLTGAGFSEEQTEALFEVYGGGHDSLATKEDLQTLATKNDLQPFATKDDLQPLATKEALQALELRHTLRVGGMVVAGVAVMAVLDRL